MVVLAEGAKKRVVSEADDSGRHRGRDFLDGLDVRHKAKFQALFDRMGSSGRIRNETQFRKELGQIYCFKVNQHRIACFFDGHDVVIVSGFTKKTMRNSRSQRELKKADGLRSRCLDRRRRSQ